MKVAILAGGFGTRISEESHLKPKPMIEIGGKPILWHIMKHYSSYGYNEFVICAGYKQHAIKEYFANYYLYQSDITFDFTSTNEINIHHNYSEPWKITIVDTGLSTMTGGRVKRIQKYVGNEPFMLTYGDGLSDIDITKLVEFHMAHGKTVTMSAYNIGQRFGILDISEDGHITAFREKARDDGGLINIGFMVINPNFFNFIEGDSTILEKTPMETMASMSQLMSYKHDGFWQCMDNLREKELLEELWESGSAPWKRWDA
jgi:glucose-1-phosphate cytidylyltransferase